MKRKKPMPSSSPSRVRVPAPAERNEPSTNGMASSTENAMATVRAMRDQNAKTYSRASSELAWKYWIRRHSERLVSWPGLSTASPRKPAVTLDSRGRWPDEREITLSSVKRDSA